MSKIYRLLVGTISRPNAQGHMEQHRGPYDFIPTEAELAANKWRMVYVKDTPDNAVSEVIAEKIPADTLNDVSKMSSKDAIAYINTLASDALEDALKQENSEVHKARTGVLKAIQMRREYLAFVKKQSADLLAHTNSVQEQMAKSISIDENRDTESESTDDK